jgi:predicted RNA-binding protein with PIN domain
MPVIIDGYNLLRAIQKTDEEFKTLTEAGLCRILSEYLKRIRSHGHIVFDGLGPPDKSDLGGFGDLEVYFSGPDTDADTIIEQKILDNSAPKSLLVVSTDRRLQAAAGKRKVACIRSEPFFQGVVRQLDRKKPIPEPQQKRRGLTDSETEKWMDLFGLDR